MDSRFDRKRMNVEGYRLSSLSDYLIHKILSFVSIKHAVQTSVLSSKWRFIWTSMPYLDFSSKDFRTRGEFSKFVTRVLSNQKRQVEVFSVKLTFSGAFHQPFVKRILKYAFSHNVQELNIVCFRGDAMVFPLSVLSSQTLKTLSLNGCSCIRTSTTRDWDLPALTTLNLHSVPFYDDKCASLFSKCANLKNLTIKHCRMMDGLNYLNVRHPGLTNLTLECSYSGANVVTPQLKNLTIKNWGRIRLISAPNLSSLHYKDTTAFSLELSSNIVHLNKVDISILSPIEHKEFSHKIFCLLQRLCSVKFLTLNLELVKRLSSFVELISHQPSPFTNLKSLNIHPAHVTPKEHTQPKVTMSPEVKSFLLDGSPGATFTMVSHEENRAVMDVVSARNLMGELHVLLDQLKYNSETNMESHIATVHEQGEVSNHKIVKSHYEERMAHTESYWEDLNKQSEKWSKNTSSTISMLRKIKAVLAKLPTSHRDKLLARFSGLYEEAEAVMDDMMDSLKINCDKKPLSFQIHELPISSQPSS